MDESPCSVPCVALCLVGFHLCAAAADGDEVDAAGDKDDGHDFGRIKVVEPPVYGRDAGHGGLHVIVHAAYGGAQVLLSDDNERIA